MAQAATAQKAELSPALAIAMLPKDRMIAAENVTLAEHGYRSFFVRLPVGIKNPQDLVNDPGIWTKVQGSKNVSLRKHDHIYFVGYDDTWAVDAIVDFADHSRVTLTGIRNNIQFKGRTDPLPGDDNFRGEWMGNGYQLFRRKDNRPMGNVVATVGALATELQNQYPRPAA
jgi:hypothetical protein